jgi:hypothetical protein
VVKPKEKRAPRPAQVKPVAAEKKERKGDKSETKPPEKKKVEPPPRDQ